jgi:sorting nexin-13
MLLSFNVFPFPCAQSSACTKQLAFDLLELLLLTAFPELDSVFRQLREEKHKFGEFKPN